MAGYGLRASPRGARRRAPAPAVRVARGHSVAGCQHGKLLDLAAQETSTKKS
jgi:hypothetical protein